MSIDTKEIKLPTVRCARTKDKEYTFKNVGKFNKQWALKIAGRWKVYAQDLLDSPAMTNAELLALYADAQQRIDANNQQLAAHNLTEDNSAIMLVPVAALTLPPPDSDKDWSRDKRIDLAHVASIVSEFSPEAQALPLVTLRRGTDEQGEDTVFARIADGTHRTVNHIEQGATAVKCKVIVVGTAEEEADVYTKNNQNRRPNAQVDLFKARYMSGDPALKSIVEMAKEHKLEVAMTNMGRPVWPKIKASAALEDIYTKRGGSNLDRVFQLITSVGLNWECWEALQSDVLHGLSLFVSTFEVPGFAHPVVIEEMMRSFSPSAITQMAQSMPKETCQKTMHMTIKSKAQSQTLRHYSVCAALAQAYGRTVNSMIQNKKVGATQFKKLWECWNSNELGRHKRQTIAYYQEKLSKLDAIKMTPTGDAVMLDENNQPLKLSFETCWELPDASDARYNSSSTTFTR